MDSRRQWRGRDPKEEGHYRLYSRQADGIWKDEERKSFQDRREKDGNGERNRYMKS